MADVAWVLCQLLVLSYKSPQKRGLTFIISIYLAILTPVLAASNRSAVIDIHRYEKHGGHPRLSVSSLGHGEYDLVAKNVIGRFAEIGKLKNAEGRLHLMPQNCREDERGFARLPEDWVAVFHYGERSGGTAENLSAKCFSVIDRVQRALMFGASAIIILSLNPRILKELDARQMFSCPVVIVDAVENVTNFMNVLKSKMKIKAKIFQSKAKQNFHLPTLTLWATCGRPTNGHSYHEWDGVVCLGKSEQQEGKADPTSFWNFFYSGIFLLLMLLAIKARLVGDDFGEPENELEISLRHLAHQALSVMKTRKYRYDSRNDVCAVCLEKFFPKQKLRVLPCLHEFHTKCVDPWLVKRRTCPLCKLNIVEDSSPQLTTS